MNRRGFLAAMAAIAGTAAFDPEKLLWVPGKKLISIPALPKEEWRWVQVYGAYDSQKTGFVFTVPVDLGVTYPRNSLTFMKVSNGGTALDRMYMWVKARGIIKPGEQCVWHDPETVRAMEWSEDPGRLAGVVV